MSTAYPFFSGSINTQTVNGSALNALGGTRSLQSQTYDSGAVEQWVVVDPNSTPACTAVPADCVLEVKPSDENTHAMPIRTFDNAGSS